MKSIPRKICILGSTGSIGCNSLEVIDNLRNTGHEIRVVYLSTNSRIDILASQINKYSPSAVVIQNEDSFAEFKSKYSFPGLEVLCGRESVLDISASSNYDFLINALVGFSGLEPTVAAIKSGKDVALANKETLVAAGRLVNSLLKKHKVNLIPIDSEHSAILQCLIGEEKENIEKIILTASGGPFRTKTLEEIVNSTVEDALDHPNWKMGNKITIDSATMMNKGLEVIEAKWLFDIDAGKIQVLIHPQSIIHSMIQFIDGSVKSQMGVPDMKLPIQYALTYPGRVQADYPRIDFNRFNCLTFEKPDFDKFRCLKIAFEVLKAEGTMPVVMNAANEIAVELFLNKKINFGKIPEVIETELETHANMSDLLLENIIAADTLTRNRIRQKFS